MKHIEQSGSVLAISLVLLTVITLLAMMGMQRSGLQTKIVANQNYKQITFHGAGSIGESGLQTLLTSNTAILSDAIEIRKNYDYQASLNPDLSNVPGPGKDFDSGSASQPHLTKSSTVTYRSNGNDPGNPDTSGLRQDFSRGKNGMGVAPFEIESTASLPNDIASTQLLGFHLITPEQ